MKPYCGTSQRCRTIYRASSAGSVRQNWSSLRDRRRGADAKRRKRGLARCKRDRVTVRWAGFQRRRSRGEAARPHPVRSRSPPLEARAWVERKQWVLSAEAAFTEAVDARPLDGAVRLEPCPILLVPSTASGKAEDDCGQGRTPSAAATRNSSTQSWPAIRLFQARRWWRRVAQTRPSGRSLTASCGRRNRAGTTRPPTSRGSSSSRRRVGAGRVRAVRGYCPSHGGTGHTPGSSELRPDERVDSSGASGGGTNARARPLGTCRCRLRPRRHVGPAEQRGVVRACLPCRLIVGDNEGYRDEFVQETQRREGQTSSPFVAYVLARTCTLAAEPVAEPEQVISAGRGSTSGVWTSSLEAFMSRAPPTTGPVTSLRRSSGLRSRTLPFPRPVYFWRPFPVAEPFRVGDEAHR